MFKIEGADIGKTKYVIGMRMGDQKSVDILNAVFQHMFPEIRSCVYNYPAIFMVNTNGAASTLIAGVCGQTHRTCAANFRYTGRSAGTEKRDR